MNKNWYNSGSKGTPATLTHYSLTLGFFSQILGNLICTPEIPNMTMEKSTIWRCIYFLWKMVSFQCHVSFHRCIDSLVRRIQHPTGRERLPRTQFDLIFRGFDLPFYGSNLFKNMGPIWVQTVCFSNEMGRFFRSTPPASAASAAVGGKSLMVWNESSE